MYGPPSTPSRRAPVHRARVAACAFAAIGCYRGPDLPTTPWEAPPLVSGEDDAWRLCAPDRPLRVGCTLDGDTFDGPLCGNGDEGSERFRMLGINAPEIEHPGEPAQCWGDIASQELGRVLNNRTVTISFDRFCTDVYSRTLAYVWMELGEARQVLDPRVVDDLRVTKTSGIEQDTGDLTTEPVVTLVLINEYMLRAGYARRFDEDWVEPLRWEPEMIAAERTAQVRGMGLWATCEP
jgi:endonuclease YncB( thermonuclease family)